MLIFPSAADKRRFENAANIKKKHRPIDGYRTEFIETPMAGAARAWGSRVCTCATPRILAKIHNAEYPAGRARGWDRRPRYSEPSAERAAEGTRNRGAGPAAHPSTRQAADVSTGD